MKRSALLAVPLLLTACIPDPFGTKPDVRIDPEKMQKSQATLIDPEIGTPVNLAVGGTLTIELDANPTTGIWWQDPQFDPVVLELVSNDYVADPAPEGVVGSGGRTIMVFSANGAGDTEITSDYSRGGGEVYNTLQIKVTVSE